MYVLVHDEKTAHAVTCRAVSVYIVFLTFDFCSYWLIIIIMCEYVDTFTLLAQFNLILLLL